MIEPVESLASLSPAVVVLGAAGMLGQDVVKQFRAGGFKVIAADRQMCNVTHINSCRRFFSSWPGAVVVNCAAYTNVNQAEVDKDAAFAVNAIGAGNVACCCREVASPLCVYVSTDYVFPGNLDRPYDPDDQPEPLNVYGKSKLAGEHAVQTVDTPSLVVRTSWLFGNGGPNFVDTMLKAASANGELTVIDDQVGSPTYTVDLAAALVRLVQSSSTGIVHATNSGSCSWFEFACAIFDEAGIHPASIAPVTSAEFATPATRPLNSRLSNASLLAEGVPELPHWRDALQRFLTSRQVRLNA